MKTLFLFLPIFLVLFACDNQEVLKNEPEIVANQAAPVVQYQGVFVPTLDIKGTGTVKIYTENKQVKLALEKYTITEGPDLKVYLSKSNTPTDFVNLGNLNANIIYNIPQNIDFKEYRFVLIHCQQYNHLFAIAELSKN